MASNEGKTDVVKELLSHGANVSLQDRVRILSQVIHTCTTYSICNIVHVCSVLGSSVYK